MKIPFVDLSIKAENCKQSGVKQTQPSLKSDSTNEYLIRFYLGMALKYRRRINVCEFRNRTFSFP
jgi:hypothetical protein